MISFSKVNSWSVLRRSQLLFGHTDLLQRLLAVKNAHSLLFTLFSTPIMEYNNNAPISVYTRLL